MMEAMKAAGAYTPQIFKLYRTFLLKQGDSLEQAAEAHELLESRQTAGKLILKTH